MKIKLSLLNIFSVAAVASSLLALNAQADNSCPSVVDDGSQVQFTFSSAGLNNQIGFGYNGEIAANVIQTNLGAQSTTATIPLAPLTYFSSFISIPVSCDAETLDCNGAGSFITVARYRLDNDLALVIYNVGESTVTTVVNFSGSGAPTITCHGTDDSFDVNSLIASIDLTSANEQIAYDTVSTCSDSEIFCPSIIPNSIRYFDNAGGITQRGPQTLDRARALAKKGLRTGGLDNRKKILAQAIRQLNLFVVSARFRVSSTTLRISVRKNIALAKRAIDRRAGTKMVHAALLAIQGR